MFTGLVEEVGNVLWIRASDRGTQLQIAAPKMAETVRAGDSVCVNGCCLTVSAHRAEQLSFDLLEETLQRTNLKSLRRDSPVNLEPALAANGRLGGHFVQGHIDCAARVISCDRLGPDYRLEVELPAGFRHYVANKGSVAVNGVSLTIAEVSATSFAAHIIPHTRQQTNIDNIQTGDMVNVEFDILAKYVEQILARQQPEK